MGGPRTVVMGHNGLGQVKLPKRIFSRRFKIVVKRFRRFYALYAEWIFGCSKYHSPYFVLLSVQSTIHLILCFCLFKVPFTLFCVFVRNVPFASLDLKNHLGKFRPFDPYLLKLIFVHIREKP